jgi:hypothetical protein
MAITLTRLEERSEPMYQKRQHAGRETAPTTPKSAAPAPVRAATASGGQALDRHTQTEMSARFGHSFSQVRIHTDRRAAEGAKAAGANALAFGNDIIFGEGKFNPGSPLTDRLLAHELTHVVQQAQHGPGDWGRTSHKGDASEREADSLAAQVMMGRSVKAEAAPGAALARDEGDGQGVDPAAVSSNPDAPTSFPGDVDAAGQQPATPAQSPAGQQPTPAPQTPDTNLGSAVGVPQLSTPVNDAIGVGLGICGMVPGAVGAACTEAGAFQSVTQAPTDKNDPQYKNDSLATGLSLGLAGASTLGLEAAGPLGLVASAGMAIGHGAQALGNGMIEGGIQNNPGQFGPNPLDSM